MIKIIASSLAVASVLISTSALAEVTAGPGKWFIYTETSALTDETNKTYVLQSDNDILDSIGRKTPGSMVVACSEKSMRVVFAVEDYMGNQPQRMIYRLDTEKPQKIRVSPSTDGKAVGLWDSEAKKFLEEIISAKRLVIGVSPYNEARVEVIFLIDGIRQIKKEIGPCS